MLRISRLSIQDTLPDGSYRTMSFQYGPDCERWYSELADDGVTSRSTVYAGNYEKVTENGVTREFYYLDGNVIVVKQNDTFTPYLAFTDHLGSVLAILDEYGLYRFRAEYDVWGKPTVNPNLIGFHRGYTGHEMLPEFDLINMNGRLYDPMIGRFLSPDNYVQEPDNSQNFNRYSYCLNNPLKYTDPSGESFLLTTIIGAVVGTYMGGVLANNSYNPTKWDFSSAKTWGYMFCGGMLGAGSGYVGAALSSAGFAGSNTVGIMASSSLNSLGTYAYTLGETPISIYAGIISYDFTNHEFGFLWKKGNSNLDNWMYGLGALANLSDVLMGTHPKDVDLVTEHSDVKSHTSIVNPGTDSGDNYGRGNPALADPNGIISYGPDWYHTNEGSVHWTKGTNFWQTHSNTTDEIWRQTLQVNKKTIVGYGQWLNRLSNEGSLIYSVEFSSCVTHASIALNASGLFNIGIHPWLLHAQMYLWGHGIRPWSFASHINQ